MGQRGQGGEKSNSTTVFLPLGVRPDLLLIAKGIASGLPLSAVACNRKLVEKQVWLDERKVRGGVLQSLLFFFISRRVAWAARMLAAPCNVRRPAPPLM